MMPSHLQACLLWCTDDCSAVKRLRGALTASQHRVEELELQLLSHGHHPTVTRPLAGMLGVGFQQDTEGLQLNSPPNPLERCTFALLLFFRSAGLAT